MSRSASGIRGPDVDDWPCLSDPADLALLRQYFNHRLLQPSRDPAAHDLITAGLAPAEAYLLQSPPTGRTLVALGDPRLPFTIFERPLLQTDRARDRLPLQLTGDPRLPPARDYPWTDLLLIGTDPNFAMFDLSLCPLTITNSPREAERIRWALHSLCQATLEAISVPLPRLRRLRARPVIPPPPDLPATSAGAPGDPPDTQPVSPPHYGPDRPPGAQTVAPGPQGPSRTERADAHLTPLHSGVPAASPWRRPNAPITYGTLWSSLQCGPHHVALAGYTTSLNSNLRVGSLNTNGLTSHKLTELLWYMRLEQLDVFFLIDTRATQRSGKFLCRQARDFLGPGCVAQVSPARPAMNGDATSRHALVGGQILLVAPTWGSAFKSSRQDPTG